jgi:hypothetical protein
VPVDRFGRNRSTVNRDRALHPVVLTMIAALYGLFAAIEGTPGVIVTAVACMVPFAACSFPAPGRRPVLYWRLFAAAPHPYCLSLSYV